MDHPEALGALPNETLIFDWQYFSGCRESAQRFVDQGFEVVACPTLQTYNSTWLNLQSSEDNVRKVQSDVVSMNLFGTCLTTWECALFGSYETLKPAIIACGQPLQEGGLMRGYLRDSETYEEWARLMGVELVEVGGLFAAGRIRSSLKVRLLLNANPFLAWLYHGEELSGEVGDMALDITERALSVAPNEITKAVAFFARSAVEFVRLANVASKEYASGRPESAISKLALTRTLFEDLGKVAKRNAQRDGASLADVERCRVAKEHVEKVITRIRNYGNRELGYLPSFEHLTHPKFVPHDQGAWWLVNRWANE